MKKESKIYAILGCQPGAPKHWKNDSIMTRLCEISLMFWVDKNYYTNELDAAKRIDFLRSVAKENETGFVYKMYEMVQDES